MTITELITNFRRGLIGVLPAFEEVGVPWRRPDAYDEWDAVAAAMYSALVIEPIKWALNTRDGDQLTMPEYDMLRPDYHGMSVIELVADVDGPVRVFHAFGSLNAPLDCVEWRLVDAAGQPLSSDVQCSAFDGTQFALRHPITAPPPQRIVEVGSPR